MRLKYAILVGFLLSLSFTKCLTQSTAADNQNALLTLSTNSEQFSVLSMRNVECVDCGTGVDMVSFTQKENVSLTIKTFYPSYYIYLYDRFSGSFYCTDTFATPFTFGENATYALAIDYSNKTKKFTCEMKTLVEPQNIDYPLIIAFSILLGVGLVYALAKFVFIRYQNKPAVGVLNNNIVNSDFGTPIQNPASSSSQSLLDSSSVRITKPKSSRMKSIDVLRGMCLAIMMFANFGAGGYSYLDHSVWNGIQTADFVFPCFVFIMGISIPLSLRSISSKQESGSPIRLTSILFKIAKRTALLFFFGLYTSNSYNSLLNRFRIMGVLQRFAISYFVCALIELLYFHMNNYKYVETIDTLDTEYLSLRSSKMLILKNALKEIVFYPIQWLIILFLTILWLLVTFLLPVKNCPTGYLGPGGLHKNSSHYNCTGGSAGYIDRYILGSSHVYGYPTCRDIYETTVPYDPEGLLGSLTSCVLAYLGVATGHIIMHYKKATHRISKFFGYSVLYGLIAGVLCKFSRDDGWIPINKNLWSLSFILAIASIALLGLIFLYLIVDLADVYSGTPFLYLGRNSISIYICHAMLTGGVPTVDARTMHPILLLYNFYWITIWTLLAYLMNYKKVFISL
jgi:heparan-alpha-glucosaminide N-acetyltransferase